jgi:hypothetical protein
MPVDATDAVWGDGKGWSTSASFSYVHIGVSGSTASGDYALKGPAWFVSNGCTDYECAKRIDTDHTQLADAKLVYHARDISAIK